jgi:hypothetical protein
MEDGLELDAPLASLRRGRENLPEQIRMSQEPDANSV